MQVKKEEMREKILAVAMDEFMKHGYEAASMRVIAQKSHTTIGNIYHYFQNKEALLEAILLPTIEHIETMIEQHIDQDHTAPLSKAEAIDCANHLEEYFEHSMLSCFFDRRVVILLKLESSHLYKRKEAIMEVLQAHLQEHFQMDQDAHYAKVVLDVLADCLKHVLMEHESIETAKAEFIKLFRLFCVGVIGQMK